MEFIKVIFSLFNEMSVYLLLGFLFAGILHVFVPQKIFSKYLSDNNFLSVFYAALFGVPLPLCSCGVIPTAMALYKQGASKGSVVSFLIATPQTGVDSIIATYSLLGLPFAIIRPIAAFVTALFAGATTNIFTKKDNSKPNISTGSSCSTEHPAIKNKFKQMLHYGFVEMLEDIGKWLIVGLLVAGLITFFVPDDFFTIFAGNTILTMVLIVVVAIPMYICATGSIPIAIALMLKAMSPGTAFVLLMAGPAANIASILIIGKVLGRKTLILYLATIIIGAIGFGIIIDYILPSSWFTILPLTDIHLHSHSFWFKTSASIILLYLIINALFKRDSHKNIHLNSQTVTYKVDGMRCNNCKNNVIKVLTALENVKSVEVNLQDGIVYVEGNAKEEEINKAVSSLGFSFKGKI